MPQTKRVTSMPTPVSVTQQDKDCVLENPLLPTSRRMMARWMMAGREHLSLPGAAKMGTILRRRVCSVRARGEVATIGPRAGVTIIELARIGPTSFWGMVLAFGLMCEPLQARQPRQGLATAASAAQWRQLSMSRPCN